MDLEKEAITAEYIKMYSNITSWWLNCTGFTRFGINKNQIVEKSFRSVVYGAFVSVILNMMVIHVLYAGIIRDNFLCTEEVIIVLQINLILNCFLLNITLSDRRTGSDILHHCIDIDMLLGAQETKFMRDVVIKINTVLSFCIFSTQFGFAVALFIAFDVEMDVHITGSTFFIFVFSIIYDFLFLLAQYSFLSMRVRYLNVALMKAALVKIEYLPKIFLFNGTFWKENYTDYVTFQERADLKLYLRAFEMIYDHLRCLEKSYRFTFLFLFACVLLNSLFTVHTIFVVKEMELLRKMCITMSIILSWVVLLAVSQRTDIVLRQLEQTKVICVYAQLKPSNKGVIFKLTKSILNLVETREARPSIYGIFYFDSGMVLRLAASTFVYITFLLQSRLFADDATDKKHDNNTQIM